jgi:hypothetical protein
MKAGSTSGPLGITVEHLLYAIDETLEAFLLLTHATFAGTHAAEAVIGEIRPFYKSDEKFRPIALLEISHKLVTATVASRLSSRLFKHKLVNPSHFGFLQGGSVSLPIRILTTLYERARAEHIKTGDGNDCHAEILDLVSAFDNVSHALLEAAFARIGAPPAFCHWIRNLLHNQRRFVSTAGRTVSSNESFILEGGLPQGCASSPIFFVVYFDVLIASLHIHMGAQGCTLGNALVQSIVF